MACIILGVTGSIAAYKAADIASALVKHGHDVHCVCTAKALEFVTPLTLHTISRNPVFSSFDDEKGEWIPPHIQLAQTPTSWLWRPPRQTPWQTLPTAWRRTCSAPSTWPARPPC